MKLNEYIQKLIDEGVLDWSNGFAWKSNSNSVGRLSIENDQVIVYVETTAINEYGLKPGKQGSKKVCRIFDAYKAITDFLKPAENKDYDEIFDILQSEETVIGCKVRDDYTDGPNFCYGQPDFFVVLENLRSSIMY